MSLSNPWRKLQTLIAGPPLQVGEVVSIDAGLVTVELPGGGQLQARGAAEVGDHVFLRGRVIEGPAPDLPIVTIEI